MNLSLSAYIIYSNPSKQEPLVGYLITNSHYIIDTLHYSKAHRHGSILPVEFLNSIIIP